MTHPLEGVQFRARKATFPTYKEDEYEDWSNVPVTGTTSKIFATGTQFRMAPVIQYQVIDEAHKITDGFLSKTDAMALVSKLIDAGQPATIKSIDKTPDLIQHLFNRNVQFSVAGTYTWRAMTYFNPSSVEGRISFRVRPDHHFQVAFTNPLQSAVIDFDDVEKLAQYVDNKIRTGHYDFNVRAISYGS